MKKIGIIGSGAVGVVLANGFIKHGYEVMLGTNNLEKHDQLIEKTAGNVTIGNFAEVARFGEILVLAVKGLAAMEILNGIGENYLNGKTILDATNPISAESPVNGVLNYYSNINFSAMETFQKAFPQAHFVKCFNSVGSAFMVNPNFGGVKPSMFICGNDENSKQETKNILDAFGWETADVGSVEAARAIEPLCMLWCIPGFKNNSWSHAFKLLSV